MLPWLRVRGQGR